MRACVRVLPLFAVAALFAGCAAKYVAKGNTGATRYSALGGPTVPAASKAAREQPDQALLARQPPARCELAKPLEGVPPDQAHAAMLDYEQQCYKQLAEIEHARLDALQDAAATTHSLGSGDRVLLERQPPPHCDPSEPPPGLSPEEGRAAALDAKRQCYKELEATERRKLDALQDAFRMIVKAAHKQRGETLATRNR
jgi:hypothetical protein